MSLIKTQVRIPERLRDLLVQTAQESGRSMNAEIVERLSSSFHQTSSRMEELLIEIRDALIGPGSGRRTIDVTRLDDRHPIDWRPLMDAIASKPIRPPEGK